MFCKKFELRETFFEFMCEEGDESASFEIQLIRLDIFSVGGFKDIFSVGGFKQKFVLI